MSDYWLYEMCNDGLKVSTALPGRLLDKQCFTVNWLLVAFKLGTMSKAISWSQLFSTHVVQHLWLGNRNRSPRTIRWKASTLITAL